MPLVPAPSGDPHGLGWTATVPGRRSKIRDDLFELDGIDERAYGLWVKYYDRLNLFTDHLLQNVPDDILVLVNKFLVRNGLVNFKWHDDQKRIIEALVRGISYDRTDAEPMRRNMDPSLSIERHLGNWSGLTIDS